MRARLKDTAARHSGSAKDPSIGFIVAAIFSVVALVWFILWLGDSSGSESVPLGEEAVVLSADTTLLPSCEAWLGIDLLISKATLQQGQVTVSRVMRGSPAEKAGLRAGDVVVRTDGKAVRKPHELGSILARHKKNETLSITVDRNGRQRKFHVTLASRPMGTLAAVTTRTTATASWLGVDVQAVDNLMVERLNLPDRRGVIIAYVYPGSPAALAGLAQADVIRRVGETRLRDIDQLERLVASRRPGDILRLTVWHQGAQQQTRVTLSDPPPPTAQPQPTLPEAEVEIEAAWLGLDIVPLSRAEAEELGLPETLRGMVVDDVAAGRGVDVGFVAGDVITAINSEPTPTVGDFRDATEGAVGALVDVVRAGRHIYIAVPPPGAGQAGKRKPAVRQVMFRFR